MKRLALLSIAIAGPALADPPNLTLTHEPSPRSLRMRRVVAQSPTPAPTRPPTPMPAAPAVSATAPITENEDLEGLRDIKQRVSASVTMGYQVDGARSSGEPNLAGDLAKVNQDYAKLRSYGFGEGFLSTRGVGLTSLESYFAIRFQAARTIQFAPQTDPGHPVEVTSPIATWFERSGTELRSGWLETKDFLPKRWGLSKLRVRAGSQYIYGPWILHLDGVNIAYEGPTLTLSTYSGARHTDYSRDQSNDRPIANGASLRLDLRGVTENVPIAVEGEVLSLSKSTVTGQEAVHTEVVQADWRPRRDVAVIAQVRGVDGALANQRIEVRTRYKQVTNFVIDVMRRFDADWRWDPSLARPSSTTVGEAAGEIAQSLDARRYLDLGPVLPQLITSVRAGTMFRENIDLLARIAIASDLLKSNEQSSSYAAPYVELGGAVEIKLRRQVALGFSILSRQTNRDEPAFGDRIQDHRGLAPDALIPDPALNGIGEQGFTELGGTLKMTLGARRFSALIEAYGRRTRYSQLYVDAMDLDPVPATDLREGGRFTVDAWVNKQIRMFVSYDVSSRLAMAPEISGYKSLRLTLTGTY